MGPTGPMGIPNIISSLDAWRAPKVGRCPVGWVLGGVFPLQPTRGSEERRELPQGGPGQSSGRKRIFWRILKATERSFSDLYDKNLGDLH